MILQELVRAAIKEDMPHGDVTTESLALKPRNGRARPSRSAGQLGGPTRSVLRSAKMVGNSPLGARGRLSSDIACLARHSAGRPANPHRSTLLGGLPVRRRSFDPMPA